MEYIFWISCFLIFYNYAGYAIFVYMINLFKKKKEIETGNFFPKVSFIVAAYNEEDCIEQKISNSIEQIYPAEKLEFIFITDGSTDRTIDIILNYPAIRLLHKDERKGKSAALNRAVSEATGEVLVFSDANTILNPEATINIVRHYNDGQIGAVAGEKKVIAVNQNSPGTNNSEGIYWKYESFLKQLDSDFYSVVGAAGELFSLRKNLYEPISDNIILDDFVISLKVAQKGYRIVYEKNAYAMELPSFSLKEEQKRKIRIAAGGFQAIGLLGSLFYFWKYPRLTFLYVSHRLLRWTLSPLCLIIAFISNLILCFEQPGYFYLSLFVLQALFYAMGTVAKIGILENKLPKVFRLCNYFIFMNVSVISGFLRFLKGKQPVTWEKAKRSQFALSKKG